MKSHSNASSSSPIEIHASRGDETFLGIFLTIFLGIFIGVISAVYRLPTWWQLWVCGLVLLVSIVGLAWLLRKVRQSRSAMGSPRFIMTQSAVLGERSLQGYLLFSSALPTSTAKRYQAISVHLLCNVEDRTGEVADYELAPLWQHEFLTETLPIHDGKLAIDIDIPKHLPPSTIPRNSKKRHLWRLELRMGDQSERFEISVATSISTQNKVIHHR